MSAKPLERATKAELLAVIDDVRDQVNAWGWSAWDSGSWSTREPARLRKLRRTLGMPGASRRDDPMAVAPPETKP